MQLEYNGFCAWTLSHTNGFLLTGNVSIGIMEFDNRYYSFYSPEASYKWAKDPIRYIKSIFTIVRIKVDLINILNMRKDLEDYGRETL